MAKKKAQTKPKKAATSSLKFHDSSNFKLIVLSLLLIILAMSVRMMVLGHDFGLLTSII